MACSLTGVPRHTAVSGMGAERVSVGVTEKIRTVSLLLAPFTDAVRMTVAPLTGGFTRILPEEGVGIARSGEDQKKLAPPVAVSVTRLSVQTYTESALGRMVTCWACAR